jgi:hypothetical protein
MKKAAPTRQRPAHRKSSVSLSRMYHAAKPAKTTMVMISCITLSCCSE